METEENIMLENIWRYSINEGESGGIVIANTKEKAEQKVKEMYEDYGDSDNAEDEITVWKAILDDDYSKDYPDVLEIY